MGKMLTYICHVAPDVLLPKLIDILPTLQRSGNLPHPLIIPRAK